MAGVPAGTSPRARRLVALSFVLTLLGALIVLFVPLGTRVITAPPSGGRPPADVEASPTPSPSPTVVESHRSLVAEQGWGLLFPVAIPVVLAGLALLASRRGPSRGPRLVATVLMLGWTLISLASIGVFFLPGSVAMAVAAGADRERAGAPS